MEISKELFEAINGKTLEDLNFDLDDLKNVELNAFYFKCKDWVYNEGYMMKIENHYLNSIQIQIRKPTANSMYKEPWKKTFKNEIDGVIQVCQYILDKRISK